MGEPEKFQLTKNTEVSRSMADIHGTLYELSTDTAGRTVAYNSAGIVCWYWCRLCDAWQPWNAAHFCETSTERAVSQ